MRETICFMLLGKNKTKGRHVRLLIRVSNYNALVFYCDLVSCVQPKYLPFPPWSTCLSLQMTTQEVRLCGLLLREHFGEVVGKVGTHLLKSGTQNLRTILLETGMSLDLVQYLHSCQVIQQ